MVLTRLSRYRPDGNAAPAFSPRLFSKVVYAEPLGNGVTTLREIGVSAMLPTSPARSTDIAVHCDGHQFEFQPRVGDGHPDMSGPSESARLTRTSQTRDRRSPSGDRSCPNGPA